MEKLYILSINKFIYFWNVSSHIQTTACSSKIINLEHQQVHKLLKCSQTKYLNSLHKYRECILHLVLDSPPYSFA